MAAASTLVCMPENRFRMAAPEFRGAINVETVTGIDIISLGEVGRMLILMAIEKLMPSADMGLTVQTVQ
jgi:hypothetical protein